MPVGKRIRSDPDIQSKAKRSNSSTTEKKLSQLDKIGYKADKWHSMYRYLPDCTDEVKKIIYKEIGSFLNGLGGILCFGCRSNGCIYGIEISRKEEDNIRLIIDDAFKKFHPFVLPSIYRVLFREVACSGGGRSSCRKIVIEIKISTTNGLNMYEDEFHEVFIREKESYKGPLTPHEIKKFVTDMYNKRCSVGSVAIPKKKASSNLPTPIKSKGSKPVASVHPLQVCHKASVGGSIDASKDQVKRKIQPSTKGEQSTSDKNMGVEKKVVCIKEDTATAVSKDKDKDVKQDNDSKKQQMNTKIKGLMRKVVLIVKPKSSRKTDSKSIPETGTSTNSTDSNTTTTSSPGACASRSKLLSNTASSTKSHSVIDLTNIENDPVTKPSHSVVSSVSSATVSSTRPHPLHNSNNNNNKPNTHCNSILVPPSYYSSKPPPPLHPRSYYSAVPPNSTSWAPYQYYYPSSDYRPHPPSYAPPPSHRRPLPSSHLYPSYFTGYT